MSTETIPVNKHDGPECSICLSQRQDTSAKCLAEMSTDKQLKTHYDELYAKLCSAHKLRVLSEVTRLGQR
jgi:hypothetical protein